MKCTNKFIYCLEGNWNKNPRSNQSIKPMLVHIPEHTRSLSGSLLGYKTIP